MARIYPICSSSSGNSAFIGTRGHGILVDAGCSFRALSNALSLIDTSFDEIEALFITHGHTDHIKGLQQIAKHTSIPIFASAQTASEIREKNIVPEETTIYDISEGYHSAQFEVSSFRTSHDAVGSVGYKIRYGENCFGICTDTGFVTEEAENALTGCFGVLLESNYDEEMLRRNMNYSAELKRRIKSNTGHLSNDSCAEFALKLVESGTRHLILGHLSRENNTPATAEACTERYLAQRGLFRERDYTINVAPVMTTGEFFSM